MEHLLDHGSVYASKYWLSTWQNSTQNHAISNQGTFCNFFFKHRYQNELNVYDTFINT